MIVDSNGLLRLNSFIEVLTSVLIGDVEALTALSVTVELCSAATDQ